MTQEINYHHLQKQKQPKSEEKHRMSFESLATENILRYSLPCSWEHRILILFNYLYLVWSIKYILISFGLFQKERARSERGWQHNGVVQQQPELGIWAIKECEYWKLSSERSRPKAVTVMEESGSHLVKKVTPRCQLSPLTSRFLCSPSNFPSHVPLVSSLFLHKTLSHSSLETSGFFCHSSLLWIRCRQLF